MIKIVVWLISILYSSLAFSNNAVHFGGNYNVYNSDKLSNFDITPKGAGYHLIFSQNYTPAGIELSYRQDKLSANTRFDHTDSKLSLNVVSLGVGGYLSLSKSVLLRGGIAWYKIKSSLGNTTSDLQKYAIKNAWGISDDQKHTGYYLGVQYKLLSSRSLDLYTSYTYQKISDEIKNHAIGLGITFKFNLQILDSN